ncbi:hypothetical protein D3227_39615 [Mesorhizobium waimense]|uniref:Transposase IS4-like domain-containing protein n=1 Tax=Mesorhizobium waimense TaxID=1300307 RepID=A0A3A5JWH1_9HYPH|nr:transposase [Mesorhizobium waimense]RJT21511.1 hypothetical protein D3227_39615 [Mesorhizobium waimense]
MRDLFQALSQDGDFEWLCGDATVIPAHQHASGAQAKGGPDAQGLGRYKGGLGTKLHVATDSLGNPASLLASPGHRGEVLFGAPLIKVIACRFVIADRAYYAEHFHDTIWTLVPSRSSRHVQPPQAACL